MVLSCHNGSGHFGDSRSGSGNVEGGGVPFVV